MFKHNHQCRFLSRKTRHSLRFLLVTSSELGWDSSHQFCDLLCKIHCLLIYELSVTVLSGQLRVDLFPASLVLTPETYRKSLLEAIFSHTRSLELLIFALEFAVQTRGVIHSFLQCCHHRRASKRCDCKHKPFYSKSCPQGFTECFESGWLLSTITMWNSNLRKGLITWIILLMVYQNHDDWKEKIVGGERSCPRIVLKTLFC